MKQPYVQYAHQEQPAREREGEGEIYSTEPLGEEGLGG